MDHLYDLIALFPVRKDRFINYPAGLIKSVRAVTFRILFKVTAHLSCNTAYLPFGYVMAVLVVLAQVLADARLDRQMKLGDQISHLRSLREGRAHVFTQKI